MIFGIDFESTNFDKKCLPFEMQECLLSSYLREATRMFNLKVYQILCYKEVQIDNDRTTEFLKNKENVTIINY